MNRLAVSIFACALLFLAACNRSPERLIQAGNKYFEKGKYKEASIMYQKAISKDKTNAEAYYREGLNQIKQKNVSQAAAFLRRAVDLNPKNMDAAVKLGDIFLTVYAADTRKYKSVLDELRDLNKKIAQHSPNGFETKRFDAFIALAEKDTPRALADFEAANRAKPHSREVVGWYAQLLTAQNRFPEAEQLMKEMIAKDKTWGPSYDFLFLQYSKQGKKAEAEQMLRQHLQNDPASAAAHINVANYLVATDRYPEGEKVIRQLLNDSKAFPKGHLIVGDFYQRFQKHDQALAEYRAGANADKENELEYQQRIVVNLAGSNKREEAIILAKQLVDQNPKDSLTGQIYAALLLNTGFQGDVNKTVKELDDLVKNNPNNPTLRFALARAYLAGGNIDKALHQAEESVRLKSDLLPTRTLLARLQEEKGLHAKALDNAENVLRSAPNNPEANLIRAKALTGLGNLDRAQAALEKLVADQPNYNDAHLELGRVYLMKKDLAKAESEFTKVWNAKPPDTRGLLGLQGVRIAQGRTDEALATLEDLTKKEPKRLDYKLYLANLQASTGRPDAAIAGYQEILKTSPNPADIWVRLGLAQRQKNNNDGALDAFDKALTADHRNEAAAIHRAMVLEAMGRKKEARDAYGRVLQINSENAVALNNAAFLNADSGENLDQALTYAQRAKKKAPNNTNISDTLGYVYLKKNLNSEALRIFREIVNSDPKNAIYRLHLAMALAQSGDRSAAKKEAETALQQTSSADEQTRIKTFIGQIG